MNCVRKLARGRTKMTVILHREWAERERLIDEGDRLRAEANRLQSEGYELWGEANNLRGEGCKLRDKGSNLYVEAVTDFAGPNAKIEWTTGEILSDRRTPVPFREVD
jgi:hypothetical protein